MPYRPTLYFTGNLRDAAAFFLRGIFRGQDIGSKKGMLKIGPHLIPRIVENCIKGNKSWEDLYRHWKKKRGKDYLRGFYSQTGLAKDPNPEIINPIHRRGGRIPAMVEIQRGGTPAFEDAFFIKAGTSHNNPYCKIHNWAKGGFWDMSGQIEWSSGKSPARQQPKLQLGRWKRGDSWTIFKPRSYTTYKNKELARFTRKPIEASTATYSMVKRPFEQLLRQVLSGERYGIPKIRDHIIFEIRRELSKKSTKESQR